MVWVNSSKLNAGNLPIIDNVLATGQMSRQEHQSLMTALLSDRSLSDGDRRQINQIFHALQTGKIRLV